ncbi:CSL zinc finger-domain-containing protein [Achaetomium macrosporum]|uniref:Diphthamide biosynthesis protein 4 n=1 Tax=Achaetomium macrosporum TaxID=79813 RepID=A0AAN7CF68_9PEZI|nr:CSL zinc finger-domain-containing protein [Achaetomium macrosporum]
MATTVSKNVQLALALPARLRTFLARYPPASILPAGVDPETHKTAYQEETPNPFLPTKHPVTGRWHDPKYSLRRQAELVKMAREHGVEELLPYTPKGTEVRLRKRVELGLRVRGTGVGQQVKGHKHERQMGAKYVCVYRHACLPLADLVLQQNGEEETGHAGDAESYQRMEEGLSSGLSVRLLRGNPANRSCCRSGNGTGQSSRNEPLHLRDTNTAKSSHTMTSTQGPTYYEVLNLSQATLSTHDEATATALVKRAYRRALLNHHPDKTKQSHRHGQQQQQQQQGKTNVSTSFTIDEISAAYATLSRAAQRKAYDRTLQLQRQAQQQRGPTGETPSDFQTGIETVDLDDLAYDDEVDGTAGWYRSCRCGNPRGYHFTEADLEDAADLGELMVGCADCSLWLRVHFAVVDDNGEGEG